MPVGWNVPRGGKYAALNNIDKRLESLRDEKNVIVTRAGENALAGNTTRVTALKAQYELLGEKIKLLTDVRRDVEQTGDLEW